MFKRVRSSPGPAETSGSEGLRGFDYGKTYFIAASVLWLAVAGVVTLFLFAEREQTLDRAARGAEALIRVLDAHTARTYQAVDITLAGIATSLELNPGLPKNDPAFRDALKERLAALQPYVRALFVVGPNGRLVHDTDYPDTPDFPLDDRPYFQAHLRDPELEGAAWPPLRSRSTHGWFLAATHRVSDQGPFRGVVVAALRPEYFEALFDRIGTGSANVIALYHRNGTLIARHPRQEEDIGRSFAASSIFAERLPRAEAGTYITSSGVFSFERVVSYRAMEGLPLVLAMNQSTASILASWRKLALAATLVLGALAALLAAVAIQLLRHQRTRDLARERMLRTEKLEALAHLTGSVSHDFANLLNVISVSLRLLGVRGADPERQREALSIADRAILRGSQLVDRLRSFARRQPLQLREADLNALVAEAAPLLRQVVGPGVRVEEALEVAFVPCVLDETELEVALVNLLVNARDAGARRIVLRTYHRGPDEVGLAVQDDGPGMSEAVRRRAVEPYFTTKGKAGTGLGLSQVYGFMRQVGGDVHIESRPGNGTTVHLVFRRPPWSAATGEIAAATGFQKTESRAPTSL